MAIVKMKKLRLMAVRSDKEELLRELLRHGCVEISEPEELRDEALGVALKRESSQQMTWRGRQQDLQNALAVLGRYAPAKGKLLAPKREASGDSLLGEELLQRELPVAETILQQNDAIRRSQAEESRLRSAIAGLQPWKELELPLETAGTERSAVQLGTVPLRSELLKAQEALADAVDEAELFEIASDKSQRYLVLVSIKERLADALEALRPFGFSAFSPNGVTGTAKQNIERMERELTRQAEERKACEQKIVELSSHRDSLKQAADAAGTQLALCEAQDKLCGTESVVILQGWMPAEREAELTQVFERCGCAWECEEPAEDEYPEVPVQLKNNAFTNSMNMVTNMYALPQYGTVDPNPLMAPFFILFFGLMMADMGYGLLMILAAIVYLKKVRPEGGALATWQLVLYGGISTFAMGVLTGGFFSDSIEKIVNLVNPSANFHLWHLFSPETDSTLVLYGSMVLGVLHLNTGMAVSFRQKWKAGDKAGALFEEGSLWIMLLGIILFALSLAVKGFPGQLGLAVIIVGTLLLLYGSGRSAKGFGKVTAAFGCIYNTATGWFGDVLSYSRIMALMLAGGVVGKVFNTVAIMPAESSGLNVWTGLAFAIIFLLGHAMNFALNLLGCYVHDLRLQCLEFFGKFYVDGGRPFRPLTYSQTYVKAKD